MDKPGMKIVASSHNLEDDDDFKYFARYTSKSIEELISDVQAGDSNAYQYLFEKIYKKLYPMVRYRCRDCPVLQSSTDDIVNEVANTFLQTLNNDQQIHTLNGWLKSRVNYKVLELLDNLRPTTGITEKIATSEKLVSEVAIERISELKIEIINYIKIHSKTKGENAESVYATLMLLFAYEKSAADVGRELDIPPTTVRSRRAVFREIFFKSPITKRVRNSLYREATK